MEVTRSRFEASVTTCNWFEWAGPCSLHTACWAVCSSLVTPNCSSGHHRRAAAPQPLPPSSPQLNSVQVLTVELPAFAQTLCSFPRFVLTLARPPVVGLPSFSSNVVSSVPPPLPFGLRGLTLGASSCRR